jgi:N-acetylglucosaminyldiphosphoundecaprenol N-acetyl-beta-D-mannosaminyltransferase
VTIARPGDQGPPRRVVELFGVPVDALGFEESVQRIRAWVEAGRPRRHVVVNAAKVVALTRDPALAQVIRSCDMVSPDGMSVVWASRLLGRPLPERVNGTDLMERLVAVAADTGRSVYLLGARPEVVERTVEVLAGRHPTLKVAGFRDGYWSDDDEVVDAIRSAGPDYLFVGIPSPRKELWLAANLDRLGVPFAMGVGGSFDVIAGHLRRAPRWACANGLEWVWRVWQEPRRMWRRYLVGNTRFCVLVARELVRGRAGAW